MRFLPLIWADLKRRKARTILTFLSIVVAFAVFGVVMAFYTALSAGVEVAGADRLILTNKVTFIQPLPISYGARIAQVPGVEAVTHASWFGGIYQEPSNFFPQLAVEPAKYLELYPEILLPEKQKEAWLADRTGAVVGRTTAERFGWKVGDRIPIQATYNVKKDGSRTWEFNLDGIYDGAEKGTDTTQFLFHYTYLDEARLRGEGLVGWYIVRVADPSQAAKVAEAIDSRFANSPYETKTSTEKAFAQAFANQVGNIGAIATSIAAAVFFTLLLVTGNAMAQSVRERTNELAVLKTLGFRNTTVLVLVLAESCLLAAAGGLGGMGLAWLLTQGGDPTGGFLPVFYIPTRGVLLGGALLVLLGLASGALPGYQALRLRIAEALRRG